MTTIFDSADVSAVLAAAIRLHDVAHKRIVVIQYIDWAVEDYRAGHPEFEFSDSHRCYLIEQVAKLLIHRARDAGEIGDITTCQKSE